MNNILIDSKYSILKNSLLEIATELILILEKLNLEAQEKLLREVKANIDEPFSFVIIGEVKSGKSSFINALLKEKVCKVDPAPCTDIVQQIVFAETPFEESINDNLKKIGLNKDILKDISIVDTPGTNSIIEKHQIITNNFAPNSDLVVFVFPSFNPYQETAWKMLSYMKKEWQKKIIFVMQQIDRSTPKELEVNKKMIEKYAFNEGILEPKVFLTSAYLEEQGKTLESGMENIREFIKDFISTKDSAKLKITDKINLISNSMAKIDHLLLEHEAKLKKDMELKALISNKLSQRQEGFAGEIDSIIIRIKNSFEISRDYFLKNIDNLFSFSNLSKQLIPFTSKKKLSKEAIDSTIKDFKEELKESLDKDISLNLNHLVEGLKDFFNEISNLVKEDIDSKESISKGYDGFYSKREVVFKEINQKLDKVSDTDNLRMIIEESSPDMFKISFGGGAIILAGVFLTYLTELAIFDLTGGILSVLGAVGAIGYTYHKSKDIKRKIRENLDKASATLFIKLKSQLNDFVAMVMEDVKRSFTGLEELILKQQELVNPVREKLEIFSQEIKRIRTEVEKI